MKRWFIEPLDVWLFRDGRPFTAQADHHAQTLFPPSPLTLYGALRTKLLFDEAARRGQSVTDAAFVEEAAGAPGDFNRFWMRGPFPARREASGAVARLLPAPLDLGWIETEAGTDTPWTLLRPRDDVPGLVTDVGLALPWAETTARPETAGEAWLTERDFFATLLGEPPPLVLRGAELYAQETRPGVELDWADSGQQRRVTREGRLYSVSFVRPVPGAGLCVDLDGYEPSMPAGLMGLGGEARGSRYEVVEAQSPDSAARRQRVGATGRLKLVLVTPAIFETGWLPRWVDPQTRRSLAPSAGLTLAGAAIGRAQPIGGFDILAGRPRPMRQAVPAGSVYWFRETEAGAAARAFDALDDQTISDEYAGIGFGHCYVGGW